MEHTPAGWPLLVLDDPVHVMVDYSVELANKLQNSDADVAAAINAAQRAETAAATAVAAAARLAAGTIAISVTGAGGTVAVAFPAGRFTAPPVVLVSRSTSGLAKYVPYVASVTATGCVLGLYAGDGTTGGGTTSLSWLAIQL